MSKDKAIQEVCAIVGLAYHTIANYEHASDGFCSKCSHGYSYQNSGKAIEYVRQAVLLRLKQDGYTIADGFNPVTGKEKA
jgi:hypothetical protein